VNIQQTSQYGTQNSHSATLPFVPRNSLHTYLVISCTSHITRHTLYITRHTLYITRHTSYITHHTSHITRHTSHVTRHTSHDIRHTTPHDIRRFTSYPRTIYCITHIQHTTIHYRHCITSIYIVIRLSVIFDSHIETIVIHIVHPITFTVFSLFKNPIISIDRPQQYHRQPSPSRSLTSSPHTLLTYHCSRVISD
jgi:hypothetical protein